MIEVANLRKEYDQTVAVSDLSFTAQAGSIFGLLGPNGAGKSTTIGCISGLLQPTSGTVQLLGKPVQEARAELGVVPQELALYEDLSVQANLSFWGGAYGMRGAALQEAVSYALEAVSLKDRSATIASKLSGGQKRRLNFACGIIHRPKVLLLDEPTVGVDPQSRVHLLDQVQAQAAAGTCVLYTTHYMEEAQELCDQLAIVDHGKIIAAGNLQDLREQIGDKNVLRLAGRFDPDAVRARLVALPDAEIVSIESESIMLTASQPGELLPQVLAALSETGAQVRETTLSQASLESLFIQLTGKALRE